MQTIEDINAVRKYVEREPELVAVIVRDWELTKEAELSDLAWAMTRDNVWSKDAAFLLDELEAHLNTVKGIVRHRKEENG